MREEDRGRHERALLVFFAVAAGEAEHQALVARAFLLAEIAALLLGIDAHGDVGRLAVQQHLDVGAVVAEAVLVVADVAHDAARDLGQRLAVDDGLLAVLLHEGRRGAAFAGDHDLVGGDQRLAAQAGVGVAVVGDAELDVIGDERVENGVRDLVADLVRMAFGDRFTGKKIVLERHNALPRFTLNSGQGSRAANVRLSLCFRGGKSSKSVRGGIDHRGRAAKNSKYRRKSRGSQSGHLCPTASPLPLAASFSGLAAAQDFGVAGGTHGLDHLEDALAHPGLRGSCSRRAPARGSRA